MGKTTSKTPSQKSKLEDVRLKLAEHTQFSIEIADNADFREPFLRIDKDHEELDGVEYNCSFLLHRKACWLNVRQGYSETANNGANNIGATCKISFDDFEIVQCCPELDDAGEKTNIFVISIRLKKDKHFEVDHAGQGIFLDADKPLSQRYLRALPLYTSKAFVEGPATCLRVRIFSMRTNITSFDHIEKVLNSHFRDNTKNDST